MTTKQYPQGYFGPTLTDRAPQERHAQNLAPFKRHLVEFIQGLPEGARVLDLGCGSGKTIRLAKILRPDLRMEGCDINPLGEYLPEDVPFEQCSVEDVGERYEADYFDAILCQHVVEHLQSPLGLMDSISAVLKKEGQLFLETPNWVRLFTPFSHFFFWNDYTHVRLYPKFALVKLLSEYHFEVEQVIVRPTSEWFPRGARGSSPKPREKSVPSSVSAARIIGAAKRRAFSRAW